MARGQKRKAVYDFVRTRAPGLRRMHARRPPGGGPSSNWLNPSAWGVYGAGALGLGASKMAGDWFGKTKAPRHISHAPPREMGTGGSVSTYSFGYRKPFLGKAITSALAPYQYKSNSAQQLLSGIGKQASTVAVYGFNQTETAILAGKFVIGGAPNRVLLQSCHTETMMTNNYLSNCFVEIYDCVAIKDLPTTNEGSPTSAWAQGLTDEGDANGATIIGSTPWSSERFNQFWRVKNLTRVTLGQGATHKHCTSWTPNRLLSSEYINPVGFGYANLTTATFIVIHGQPDQDTTTTTQVRLGVAGLNIVAGTEYAFKFPANNTTIAYTNNTLATTFTVSENLIDVGSGAAVVNITG